MRTLVMALLCGFISFANAQNPDRTIKLDTSCSSKERVLAMLAQYGEKPMLKMISTRPSPNGKDTVQLVTIMFVNPKKLSYTIVEQFTTDILCVTSNGENVTPVLESIDDNKESKK